jgi:hypothetical protein
VPHGDEAVERCRERHLFEHGVDGSERGLGLRERRPLRFDRFAPRPRLEKPELLFRTLQLFSRELDRELRLVEGFCRNRPSVMQRAAALDVSLRVFETLPRGIPRRSRLRDLLASGAALELSEQSARRIDSRLGFVSPGDHLSPVEPRELVPGPPDPSRTAILDPSGGGKAKLCFGRLDRPRSYEPGRRRRRAPRAREPIPERERRADGSDENHPRDEHSRLHGSLLKWSVTHSGLRFPATRASSARAAISVYRASMSPASAATRSASARM